MQAPLYTASPALQEPGASRGKDQASEVFKTPEVLEDRLLLPHLHRPDEDPVRFDLAAGTEDWQAGHP